jgi:antitoxin YefM
LEIGMTRHVPYKDFRKHLPKYMDKVRNRPVHVDRKAGSVVMLSEEEYEGLVETIHLLSNPANAKDLLEGIAEADAGKFIDHGLIE